MPEIQHYLISDASKKVDVEAHVLRYWEEELELNIPRNEMGHRYYTELHIRLFQQIKELKEKGYQLKAIKNVLNIMLQNDGELIMSDEKLAEDMARALRESAVTIEEDMPQNGKNFSAEGSEVSAESSNGVAGTATSGVTSILETAATTADKPATPQEKLEQFQHIMDQIIGRALDENNEKLSQDISQLVNERVAKELDYLMRVNDEKEDERFRQLDELLRSYQNGEHARSEAAAAKIPFFKRRKFGRSGKKLK